MREIKARNRRKILLEFGLTKEEIQAYSLYRDAWQRLCRNLSAMISLVVIIVFILMAIFAPIIAPHDPNMQNLTNKVAAPGGGHPLGTDHLGRDILSRILYGARISLLVGLITELIAVPIGVILGSVAAYYGGLADMIISRIIETLGSFPFIILAMCVMFVLGPGIINVFIALGLTGWLGHARQIRAAVLQLKEREFIEAARASGATIGQIIFKHMVPNCISTIIVISTWDIPADIAFEATLSFIGLGVQPPTPSWGSMISESRKFIRQQWTFAFFPGLAMMILILAINILGDGLRDAFDPKLKNQ